MNSVKYFEGLDALLNGEDGGIGHSLNNTSYYASQNVYQDVPAADSVQNMIGLSDLIYSDGGLFSRGTLPDKSGGGAIWSLTSSPRSAAPCHGSPASPRLRTSTTPAATCRHSLATTLVLCAASAMSARRGCGSVQRNPKLRHLLAEARSRTMPLLL